MAATYDNAAYNPYLDEVSTCDPFSDSDAIKRAAATRQMMDKGGKILLANLEGDELKAAQAILEEISPNGNRQSFRAQPSATAIPDPSRILGNACPSASTLEKSRGYLDRRVFDYWSKVSEKAQFVNDFIALTEDEDPYNPKRLRFPVSSSFIVHLTPEKAAQLPLNSQPGNVFDNYQFACVSLPTLMRPGLFFYPHEFYLSILSGIAFRFRNTADFIGFIMESASTIIENIEQGSDFRRVLSGANFNKIFARPDASEEEMIEQLKQIAYFNFSKFKADYLCEDNFLEAAYLAPKQLGTLMHELDKLWTVSLPTIRAAVHRYKEEQMNALPGADRLLM